MNSSGKRLTFGHSTDAGPRETNEDTVLCIELPDGRWLLGVADGMGGLAKGDVASKTALGTLYRSLSEGRDLLQAAQDAHTAVQKEGSEEEMGTTLVATLFSGTIGEVINIGDSRAYHLDPLGLVQVTRDHTMGQEALKEGAFTAAEVASSPWAGALARYLGDDKAADVDYFGPFEIEKSSWLLLCSDGVHRVFSTEELEAELEQDTDPEETARRIVKAALEKGADDNVSVAVAYRPGPVKEKGGPTRPGGATIGPDTRRPSSTDRKPTSRRKKKKRTLILSLIGFPMLAITIFLVWWWLSNGTG